MVRGLEVRGVMVRMMMIFTSKDYNEGITKSPLYTINAEPIRHK
jgi:hypothetical protein